MQLKEGKLILDSSDIDTGTYQGHTVSIELEGNEIEIAIPIGNDGKITMPDNVVELLS